MTTTEQRLYNLIMEYLFLSTYHYNPPTQAELIKGLKGVGLRDPLHAMEQWRKEMGYHTDTELLDSTNHTTPKQWKGTPND